MSFGTYRLSANQTFKKKLVIRNYSGSNRTYTITNTYRDAPNNTGVTLNVPPSIFVAANSAASFNVSAVVNPSALPAWTLNGGSNGGRGELLNTVEYAGLLIFTRGTEFVNFPLHILPHCAANILPTSSSIALGGNVQLLGFTNAGAPISGPVDTFSLTGTEVQFPASVLPAPGSDYAVINLQAVGLRLVCVANCSTASPAFGVQFAINTYGQRSHPDVPAEFDVYIDVNNDGTDDLDVFNADIGYFTTGTFSGQNGVFIADLAAGTASGPYAYTVADLDSANAILTVPLAALTCSAGSVTVSNPFTFSVLAFDNYYTGNLTDFIGVMQYELDMPQFYTFESFSVDPNISGGLPIVPNNAANVYFSGPYNGNSPSQLGILFMYTNGKAGQEASPVAVTP